MQGVVGIVCAIFIKEPYNLFCHTLRPSDWQSDCTHTDWPTARLKQQSSQAGQGLHLGILGSILTLTVKYVLN